MQKISVMSAAQILASERFITAMGPMVNDEQKITQVVRFISLMRDGEYQTISDEDFAKLIPAEMMFSELKQMVHKFYHS